MKKFILSSSVILLFVFYLIYNRQTQPLILPSNNLSGQNLSNKQLPVGMMNSNSATPGSMMKLYRDGQYTGDLVDAYYGNVQVKAIIVGGRLTEIQPLDYPKDRENSIYISQQSIPQLIAEAITAQSAQVDVVSGATHTSRGFQQSLASALAQAKN